VDLLAVVLKPVTSKSQSYRLRAPRQVFARWSVSTLAGLWSKSIGAWELVCPRTPNLGVGKSIDHYVIAVAKAIRADIARQNLRRDLHGAHQMKASFGSRNLGLSFDFIAGESSVMTSFSELNSIRTREPSSWTNVNFVLSGWRISPAFSVRLRRKNSTLPDGSLLPTHSPVNATVDCGA
jgi:hypothetical protein